MTAPDRRAGTPEPAARWFGVLARRDPVAKLAAVLALTGCLIATLDPLTPTIALAVELAVVPLFGLRYRDLARRAVYLLPAVLGISFTLLLFAADRTGAVLVPLGPFTITTSVLAGALALSLRLVAIALPGVLVLSTTDPTDLADALIQHLRVPARFAIGTLAALRLVPLLADDWHMLTRARRARGVDAGRNPVAKAHLFAATTFALLVAAIRRATRLATAMDARGFDSAGPRSIARPQRFAAADAALVLAAAVVGAAALAASISAGTFAPLLT
jgi:energy-coupling factor transport system permease protein